MTDDGYSSKPPTGNIRVHELFKGQKVYTERDRGTEMTDRKPNRHHGYYNDANEILNMKMVKMLLFDRPVWVNNEDGKGLEAAKYILDAIKEKMERDEYCSACHCKVFDEKCKKAREEFKKKPVKVDDESIAGVSE